MNSLRKELEDAQREMYEALNPKKNKTTPLAPSTNSSYNKTKDTNSYGSYTGSSTGFNKTSSYLPGSVSKKETFVPKPKVETAVKAPSIGETYRAKTGNINKPLPRSKPETQTSPMYMPEAPKLKLNLPTSLERDFAKGALGDERETQVYNFDILDQAAKAGYLKDTRTQDDFFRTGFFGLEDTPKYAFTEKADDRVKYDIFNLLDYKTPESRLDAFKEIEERNKYSDAREARAELNIPLPGMEETTQRGFIKPAETTADTRLLDTFKSNLQIPRNALEAVGKSQIKPLTPDAIEFGEDSETYKILKDLSKRWYATSDSAEKDRLHGVAEDVRRLARGKNRVKYGTDEIFDVMHKNAIIGQLVKAGSLGTIPVKTLAANSLLGGVSSPLLTEGVNPLLTGVSGSLLEPAAFLIAMTDYGPWDYKWQSPWQTQGTVVVENGKEKELYDGKDLDEGNRRNWQRWIYFDGYLIGADKFGNMNMAYVGKKMGLPEWVYKNKTTKDDPEDIFWIDKGTDYAKSGR